MKNINYISDNIQERKVQKIHKLNIKDVSEKLQLAVAATLALMMADLSSPTQLQQQYADKGSEISQSMKEIGSKAVDKMLVGLEKVVDAIGPTSAYAGGNPDEIDELFGDTKGDLEKTNKKKKELDKEIKSIQQRRVNIEKVEISKKFIDKISSGEIKPSQINKKDWDKAKENMLKNMFVYPIDVQRNFQKLIDRIDELYSYIK